MIHDFAMGKENRATKCQLPVYDSEYLSTELQAWDNDQWQVYIITAKYLSCQDQFIFWKRMGIKAYFDPGDWKMSLYS